MLKPKIFKATEKGKFEISGDLTFSTVADIWGAARKMLLGLDEQNLEIDIGSAKNMDSGGLALLVAWSRWAHCNNKKITYVNASEKARKLVEVNKLEKLLKLS